MLRPNCLPCFQRWLPQSGKWQSLLRDDKGAEPGLGQRRVGKMNRYFITPGRPEYIPFVPPGWSVTDSSNDDNFPPPFLRK